MVLKKIFFLSFEFLFITCGRCEIGDGNVIHYTNIWTVGLSKNDDGVLEKLKMLEGFEVIQQEHDIPGLHHIIHRKHPRKGKYENKNLTNILYGYKGMFWAQQMSVNRMAFRFEHCAGKGFGTSNYKKLMNDAYFGKQWYLQDCSTNKYHTRNDLNVIPVWHKYKIFGFGIKVIVVDSRVKIDHPDLKTNYDPEYGHDFVINNHSPSFKKFLSVLRGSHGTQCAGIIAMQANNKICGVGIAPLVTLGAARIFDHNETFTNLAAMRGLLFRAKDVHISNNSWGNVDNGKDLSRMDLSIASAIKEGILKGRESRGIIYIFAGGNGKTEGDTCSHDPLASWMYTITVAGVQYDGTPVFYSERCSNVLVAAYSGSSSAIPPWANIVTTTHLFSSCTTTFSGTSAATPIVSGIVALILEANSELSWREVQHVFAWTSQVAALAHNKVWFRNKAGFYFSLDFGFGLADAFQAVTFAMTMQPISAMNSCILSIKMIDGAVFNRERALRIRAPTKGCKNLPSEVDYIEHVQLLVSVQHPRRGAIQILLISPSGTRTLLMDARILDKSKRGLYRWLLNSVHLWGESPEGVWSIIFYDTISKSENRGVVTETVLSIHGTKDKPPHYVHTRTYNKFT